MYLYLIIKLGPKWTIDYFFVQCKEKALIRQEAVAIFKEYNLRRHYESHHKDTKYDSLQGQMRADKLSKLKSGMLAQQNTFVRQAQLNQSSVRASFRVAQVIPNGFAVDFDWWKTFR